MATTSPNSFLSLDRRQKFVSCKAPLRRANSVNSTRPRNHQPTVPPDLESARQYLTTLHSPPQFASSLSDINSTLPMLVSSVTFKGDCEPELDAVDDDDDISFGSNATDEAIGMTIIDSDEEIPLESPRVPPNRPRKRVSFDFLNLQQTFHYEMDPSECDPAREPLPIRFRDSVQLLELKALLRRQHAYTHLNSVAQHSATGSTDHRVCRCGSLFPLQGAGKACKVPTIEELEILEAMNCHSNHGTIYCGKSGTLPEYMSPNLHSKSSVDDIVWW